MLKRIKKFIKQDRFLGKYVLQLLQGRRDKYRRPKKNIKGKDNKIVVDNSAVLYNCSFEIFGNNNEITIDEFSQINNVTFFIRGDNNNIKINKNVKFNWGGSIWVEDFNCEANIGENSTFENTHLAVTEPKSRIDIGKDCMFASDIDVRTGDSHSILDSRTNKRVNYAQNILIGNHVWIASHVSILKGVTIADNSVVATRSLVTKAFLRANVLIGGVPARIIKENIDWDRKRIYD